jgi:hypothetical protein
VSAAQQFAAQRNSAPEIFCIAEIAVVVMTTAILKYQLMPKFSFERHTFVSLIA